MEKAWIYQRLFFKVIITIVKDKQKIQYKRYIANQNNFYVFIKWPRVMLQVDFKKFELVFIFFAIFFFSVSLSFNKRSTSAKI